MKIIIHINLFLQIMACSKQTGCTYLVIKYIIKKQIHAISYNLQLLSKSNNRFTNIAIVALVQ